MPSNFEMAVIALLAINLILTIYYYRSQENYASMPVPRSPNANVSWDSINNKGYNITITPFPEETVSHYMYSMNNSAYVKLPKNTTNKYFVPSADIVTKFSIIAYNANGQQSPTTTISLSSVSKGQTSKS